MKAYIKLLLICCLPFLAGCASEYSVTKAQSQGTTIQGVRKQIAYGKWIKVEVASIDQKSVMSTDPANAQFWEGPTYSAPVIPNQSHAFKIWVRFVNGFFDGKHSGTGSIQATLQPGQRYFINGKFNGKNIDAWIQTKSGKHITPNVLIHCYRYSILA